MMTNETPLSKEEKDQIKELIMRSDDITLKEIRAIIRQRTKAFYEGRRQQCYIPIKWAPYVSIVTEWLYDHGLITKKTPYQMVNFAVKSLITSVLTEIKKAATSTNKSPR